MKIKLLTKWLNNELVCCCPIINQCSKKHDCEELEFILNPYDDVQDCMTHSAYKREKGGAISQKRWNNE